MFQYGTVPSPQTRRGSSSPGIFCNVEGVSVTIPSLYPYDDRSLPSETLSSVADLSTWYLESASLSPTVTTGTLYKNL